MYDTPWSFEDYEIILKTQNQIEKHPWILVSHIRSSCEHLSIPSKKIRTISKVEPAGFKQIKFMCVSRTCDVLHW